MNFNYHMPTALFFGPPADYANEFAGFGRRALIVTGRSSAKNGALDDTLGILRGLGIEAVIFNRVEDNPSIENVLDAAQTGRDGGADFVIGIGGGSPLDAAKAAALLLREPDADGQALYDPCAFKNGGVPVLAIPTTAGTGSEVTPFAILTRHSQQTKASLPHLVFPHKAFLNPAYTAFMPERVTLHTAVDALAHLAEGYLSSRANPLTDAMAEGGLAGFGVLRHTLTERRFDGTVREQLLNLSTLAGIVITQTKTTLPHQMGYALTYYKSVPHGAACGLLLAEYLRFHGNKKKTGRVLQLLDLSDVDALKEWLADLININITLTDEEITGYVQALFANPGKLKAHPESPGSEITPEALAEIYRGC